MKTRLYPFKLQKRELSIDNQLKPRTPFESFLSYNTIDGRRKKASIISLDHSDPEPLESLLQPLPVLLQFCTFDQDLSQFFSYFLIIDLPDEGFDPIQGSLVKFFILKPIGF